MAVIKPIAKRTALDRAVDLTRPALITAMVFSFFINILALVSPLYMLQVYDRVLASRNVMTLVVLTIICIVLFIVYGFLEALRTRVLVRGGLKFDGVVRDPIFKSVLESNIRRDVSGGQAFRDMDVVRDFLTGGLIAFCDAPWTPVFIFVSFILHPFFGVLGIVSSIIIFGLAISNDRATKAPLEAASTAAISAQGDVGATLRNAEVMIAMGMWRGLQQRWKLRRDDQLSAQIGASDSGGVVMASIKVFRQIVQTLILGGGAYLVIQGDIGSGAMIAGSILVGRALQPIESAVGQWKSYLASRSAWDRLQTMLRAADQTEERKAFADPTGLLSVEGASIMPPGAKAPTIRNVSFSVPAGSILAIIGPSAAGKSSLMRGLVGVWPCVAGAIKLDGVDIKNWDPQALGPHIGYLPQDIELFSGTVAQNISRFTDHQVTDVIAAAMLAGVHTMIQGLPLGYNTPIGDGGAALSGGQRQRLGLARAAYRSPALLVLDEPNANLDTAGEAALVEALIQLKRAQKTIVLATHKLNLLASADYIMVIAQGTVADFGDRPSMMAKMSGATVGSPTPPSTPPVHRLR